jgi:prolyl 4-hydroxylase
MQVTPPDIEERSARQQAKIPDYGVGFKVATLDDDLYRVILDHFAAHSRRFEIEQDPDHLRTTNPGSFPALLFEDREFNLNLQKSLKPLHERWCGLELIGAACYGIRVYQAGSYLHNHVDTVTTHHISSSICVDSRLNSPWPFYIEDIDGRPHEISLHPGEMLFYESARLKHGRPYPLDGDYYAAIFVHYTPVGWRPEAATAEPGC